MKRWIIPLMLGFGVTMAWLIGSRMSTDAMAVVVGVAVGVAASVPASLLLVALLRRDRRSWQAETPAPPQPFYPPLPQQPPIIVLNPAELAQRGPQQQYSPMPPPQFMENAGLRRLRVVGDDDEWME
ncbi:MAG TPA: hypothetical protein VGA61_00950 [Anaerolineae bacterium]